ncbi:MAG: class I SAM-dependent rRNA methyltransferase [Deltaproteobacteria bacterium]|nr:class I SAM-dependent rRNA methyltransferase [Deltaproteobacteria bacterium]MBI3294580.1 class I SAM-dependent rRNA methyltransferase [Deltaproteobacteria bacterium]
MTSSSEILERALAHRPRAAALTEACRLLTPEEGISHLAIDRYGDVIVLQEFEPEPRLPLIEAMADFLRTRLGCQCVVLKTFLKDRTRLHLTFNRSVALPGKAPPTSLWIEENGLKFLIRPNEGFSTGLFLDQRDNRQFLKELVVPHMSVLNLFCYTGSFSVYCASAGATTTSVDIAKKALEWTKENFVENSIPVDGHTFLARHALDAMTGLKKQGRRFDLIIIDPPSFSRSKNGETFSLKRDYSALTALGRDLLSDAGHLYFSCNFSDYIERGLPPVGGLARCDSPNLPATPIDFDRGKPTFVGTLLKAQK